METSPSRFTAPLSILVQWLAVAACVFAIEHSVAVLKDFDVALPGPTILAVNLSRPAVFLPIGIVTTLVVGVTECVAKSERVRFVTQVVHLCLWLTFTAFVLAALFLPFAKLVRMLE